MIHMKTPLSTAFNDSDSMDWKWNRNVLLSPQRMTAPRMSCVARVIQICPSYYMMRSPMMISDYVAVLIFDFVIVKIPRGDDCVCG